MRDWFLIKLGNGVIRHARHILIAAALVTLLSVLASLLFLTIRNSRYDLISPDSPTGRRFNRFSEDFGIPESLIVCVESPDRARTEQFCAALEGLLMKRRDLVQDILYKKPIEFFRNYGLLFLPEKQLAELVATTGENADVLRALSAHPTLEAFFRAAHEAAARQATAKVKQVLRGDTQTIAAQMRMVRHLTDGIIASATDKVPTASPWSAIVSFADEMEKQELALDPYLASHDHKMLFMFVQGTPHAIREKDGAAFVQAVREIATDLRARSFPTVTFGLTGAPALAAEEAVQTTHDMFVASIIAIIGVGIICVLGFREFLRPLLGICVLAVSIALTFALTTATIGYLNMITLTITVTLVGLGVDFSIHVLDRFEEKMRKGLTPEDCVQQVIRLTAPGIVTGAVTTSLSFFAIMLSDFRGFAQLGFIGGCGILICCVVSLLLLPAVLYLAEKRRNRPPRPPLGGRFTACVQFFLRRPGPTLIVTLFLTVLAALFAPLTRKFDYNLLNLQAKGIQSIKYEEEMFERSDFTPRFAVSIAADLPALKEQLRRLRALDTVKSVESLLSVVPAGQDRKLPEIKRLLGFLPPSPTAFTPAIDVARLRGAAAAFRAQVSGSGLGAGALRLAGKTKLADEMEALLASLARLDHILASPPGAAALTRMGAYQQHVLRQLWSRLERLRSVAPEKPLRIADLPESLRARFVGKDGRFAIYITPVGSIWDRFFLEHYVKELQSVDPEVTGPPVVLYEMSIIMLKGYKDAALYASIVIILVVLIDFRSLRASVLAILPLGLGAVWLLGVMGLIRLQFNLANLVALPLIIGIGTTSGIHMVHRFRQEGDVLAMASSTGHAVFLSLATTIFGFGSICISHHRGLRSLGLVLAIGVCACLFHSLVLLPVVMKYLRPKHRAHPAETPPQSKCPPPRSPTASPPAQAPHSPPFR